MIRQAYRTIPVMDVEPGMIIATPTVGQIVVNEYRVASKVTLLGPKHGKASSNQSKYEVARDAEVVQVADRETLDQIEALILLGLASHQTSPVPDATFAVPSGRKFLEVAVDADGTTWRVPTRGNEDTWLPQPEAEQKPEQPTLDEGAITATATVSGPTITATATPKPVTKGG